MKHAHLLAGVLLTGLAACTTVGTVTPLGGSAGVPVPAASVWSVAVRGCEAPARCEELRSAVASRLIGAGLAERVAGPGQPAEMSLDLHVSNLRAVPGAVRVLFGTMAGRSSVTATGTVQSLRGGVPVTLRSFNVESASASHPFSGESGVGDAYRQFASDVVGALRS